MLRWQDGREVDLEIAQWQFGRRQFRANNPHSLPQAVLLRTLYYPGWRVRLDGGWIPTERTDLGQLQVTVPPGEHQVTVVYMGTAMDWIGRLGTTTTLLVTAAILGWRRTV
ncbi:MAG: YfhO family protein [Synechococcaceae cyanobacterium RM1_1_27]|nr:YfhO family protein [Synechococcaceae cyanobacterium RM1_1_27]